MDASRMSGPRAGVLAAVLGTLVATVLGFLTFGAQATAGPRGVPLAVALPPGPAAERLAPVLAHLTQQGGDAVSWRVTDPATARSLLDDTEVYGVLELTPGPSGVSPGVVLSGAVNPSGTQVAERVLTTAGQALSGAVAQQQPGAVAAPVTVETVYPASAAGRILPLAASALLWLGALVAGAAVLGLARHAGRAPTLAGRLVAVGSASILLPALVVGFALLWDSSVQLPGSALGFLVLAAAAFALLQTGVLRLLGLRGVPVLALLYLMAPAVVGQVPELLHPAYRVLVWSWSPFRFVADALRSLLAGTGAPAVGTGVLVLSCVAVAGLAVLVWPARRRPTVTAPVREPALTG